MIPQISIMVGPQKIDQFRDELIKFEKIVMLPRTSEYEAFRLKSDQKLIVGYKSGKIVYQDDPEIREIIERVLYKILPLKDEIIIGSDEAGKGEWLGPLVVAAVALTPIQIVSLQALGVMDSKELSLSRIKELSKKIISNSLESGTVTVSPSRFNSLFREIKNEGKGLNDLLAWAHAKAIDKVLKNIVSFEKRMKVVIDEFDKIKTEKRLWTVIKGKDLVVVQRPKAEENIAVASASIIARATREMWIDDASHKYQQDLRALSPQKAINMAFAEEIIKTRYVQKLRG